MNRKEMSLKEKIEKLRLAEEGRLFVFLKTKKGNVSGKVELLSNKIVFPAINTGKDSEVVLVTKDDDSFSLVVLKSIIDLSLGSPEQTELW